VRAENQAAVVQRDRFGWLEPGPHRRLWKFTPRLVEETLPRFFG